jgi:accessory gene regulator B
VKDTGVALMYEKIINQGLNFLYKYGEIPEEKKEIYSYGLELILMYLTNAGSLLILGIIFRRFSETFFLLAGFALIQSFGGGFHAKTHFRCFLIMLIGWILAMLFIQYLYENATLQFLMPAIGLSVILILAPVEHSNYPMSNEKYFRMRCTVRVITTILCCTVAISNILSLSKTYSSSLSIAIFFAGISVLCATIQKKLKRD